MARWTTRWKPLVGDGSVWPSTFKRLELAVEIGADRLAKLVQVDAAGGHHLGGMGVVDQREQQMLERRIFVPAVAGFGQGGVQGLLEFAGERRQVFYSSKPAKFTDYMALMSGLALPSSSAPPKKLGKRPNVP